MTELETLIKRKKEIEAEIRRLQTEERETGRARFWVHEKANGRKYSCVSLRVEKPDVLPHMQRIIMEETKPEAIKRLGEIIKDLNDLRHILKEEEKSNEQNRAN